MHLRKTNRGRTAGALIEMDIRNPVGGIEREGQSIEDLDFNQLIFIGIRPPAVGRLERPMRVCEGAKGTCV